MLGFQTYLFLRSILDSTFLALELPIVAALRPVRPLFDLSIAPLDRCPPVLWPLLDCFKSPGLWASWPAGLILWVVGFCYCGLGSLVNFEKSLKFKNFTSKNNTWNISNEIENKHMDFSKRYTLFGTVNSRSLLLKGSFPNPSAKTLYKETLFSLNLRLCGMFAPQIPNNQIRQTVLGITLKCFCFTKWAALAEIL